jgi:uncharacterized protein
VEATFTWDPAKARRNERIHGVTFEQAREAFEDPNSFAQENSYAGQDGEQRYELIGMTASAALLFVIFVDRSHKGEERIRIISARKANDYETELYLSQG